MFHFFSRRNTGDLPIKSAEIRKGMVLTHLPTGTRRTAGYVASSRLLLIDDYGHRFRPSEKELAQQYCLRGYKLRCGFEIEALWKKASQLHQADKRLLTRLGFRLNPETIRRSLAA